MVADELDYVVGVDTHRESMSWRSWRRPPAPWLRGGRCVRAARGYAAALQFAPRTPPEAHVWAIEGTGSYGAGLARYLAGRGETVLEISRTPRAERRLRGKDDSLDAAGGAGRARQRDARLPRSGERREALRLLLIARRSAVDVRREALTQLRGVIVTAPDRLRQELRGLPAGGCSSAAAACAARAR